MVNVQCDKLAVNNINVDVDDNDKKDNKLQSVTLHHTAASKNTIEQDKSREHHEKLHQLQNL